MSTANILSFFTRMSARLRDVQSWPQLLILGLISGIASAAIIIAFRSLVDYSLAVSNNTDTHFAQYSREIAALIPLIGAILIGIVFHFVPKDAQKVSVGYVLETLAHRGGVFSWRNTFVQLFGGAAAIASGQAVGREGPAVHLGAATSAGIGRWLMLSSPQLRLLAGCGVAAAIGASFNTPIAGVIFAMEVILMEYTAAGLFPIIVAATSATALSRLVYGDDPAFLVPVLTSVEMDDTLWLLLGAIVAGIISAAFVAIHRRAREYHHYTPIARFTFIGLITAAVVYFYPQVTGVGYDVVQANLDGFLPVALLVGLLLGKLLLTPLVTGLGMPGGLIASTLFIGACLGGILEQLSGGGADIAVSSYVIIFMGTVMSAVLNAPLSALTAVLELTYAPDVLMPTMASIVVANIVCREVLKQPGVFERPAKEQTPWRRWALATPASRVMSRKISSIRLEGFRDRSYSRTLLQQFIESKPKWIVLTLAGEPIHVMRRNLFEPLLEKHDGESDLSSDLPKQNSVNTNITASAWDILKGMKKHDAEIALVRRLHGKLRGEVLGIITKAGIESTFKE